VAMADRDRSLARGRSRTFYGANVQRIRDDGTFGSGDGARDQSFRIARENRGDGDGRFDSGFLQSLDRLPTFVYRCAMGFENPAHILTRLVRAATACTRSISRTIRGPRVWITRRNHGFPGRSPLASVRTPSASHFRYPSQRHPFSSTAAPVVAFAVAFVRLRVLPPSFTSLSATAQVGQVMESGLGESCESLDNVQSPSWSCTAGGWAGS
jgi:hypothetical protein